MHFLELNICPVYSLEVQLDDVEMDRLFISNWREVVKLQKGGTVLVNDLSPCVLQLLLFKLHNMIHTRAACIHGFQ